MDSGAAQFQLVSPLGFATALFFLLALFNLVLGLSPLIVRRFGPTSPHPRFTWFIFSPGVDTQLYGRTPVDIAREHKSAAATYLVVIDMIGALFLTLAILQLSLIWFGLRLGQSWALWALALSNAPIIAYYWLLIVRPMRRLVPLSVGDLHPFATFPTVIVPIALLLGLIGLS